MESYLEFNNSNTRLLIGNQYQGIPIFPSPSTSRRWHESWILWKNLDIRHGFGLMSLSPMNRHFTWPVHHHKSLPVGSIRTQKRESNLPRLLCLSARRMPVSIQRKNKEIKKIQRFRLIHQQW